MCPTGGAGGISRLYIIAMKSHICLQIFFLGFISTEKLGIWVFYLRHGVHLAKVPKSTFKQENVSRLAPRGFPTEKPLNMMRVDIT